MKIFIQYLQRVAIRCGPRLGAADDADVVLQQDVAGERVACRGRWKVAQTTTGGGEPRTRIGLHKVWFFELGFPSQAKR
jgi:hypothetical protein